MSRYSNVHDDDVVQKDVAMETQKSNICHVDDDGFWNQMFDFELPKDNGL